jgi:p-aminobenzoyl-glutamate transporter AbgT
MMMPYSVVFLAVLTVLMIAWFKLGMSVGF